MRGQWSTDQSKQQMSTPPPPSPRLGWHRLAPTLKHAAHYVRELDNQGTYRFFFLFSFFGGRRNGGRVRSFVRGGQPFLRTRGIIVSPSVIVCIWYGAHQALSSIPIAVSGSGRTRKQLDSFDAVIHMQERPPTKRFLVGCSSPFMRLAQLITALRAWCKQISSWSVTAWRAPSRHCRDARSSYGHTTTAAYGMSTPPKLCCLHIEHR